jgi:hypothetical protein
MKPVQAGSRKVGDDVQVYDILDINSPIHHYTGKIVKITKKHLTVGYWNEEIKFHRATGYIFGFNRPMNTYSIAPETSQ